MPRHCLYTYRCDCLTCSPLFCMWECLHSWNIGPVHLISFSTEVYFYLEQGIHLVKWQYEWLESDLKVIDT